MPYPPYSFELSLSDQCQRMLSTIVEYKSMSTHVEYHFDILTSQLVPKNFSSHVEILETNHLQSRTNAHIQSNVRAANGFLL